MLTLVLLPGGGGERGETTGFYLPKHCIQVGLLVYVCLSVCLPVSYKYIQRERKDTNIYIYLQVRILFW